MLTKLTIYIKKIFTRKLILRTILFLAIGFAIGLGIPMIVTELYANPRLFTVSDAPKKRVAIVFGAGLNRDGSPALVLRDRVDTAAELYFSGKVDKILMSGDNRFLDYNEPGAMLDYALTLKIPREDIILDYAGRRTYDTCYRAKAIFGVDEALLVTQRFHLPRAILLCNMLGITGEGVIADRTQYSKTSYSIFYLREFPATFVAMWDLWISKPLPVLGKQEPIFPQS